MFTRRHYVFIAAVLRDARTHHERPNWNSAVERVARDLAAGFKRDNPNFSRARFFTAVGLGPDGHPTED